MDGAAGRMIRRKPLKYRDARMMLKASASAQAGDESKYRGFGPGRKRWEGVRDLLPINSILRRVAQKILPEKIIKPKKKDGRRSKLSDDQIREIRKRFDGRRQTIERLASEFGLSCSHIIHIGYGETHKHVI